MRSRLMRRRKFSDIQTNIELNEQGWFSVVIPEGRENLVKNPSLETNANGYVAKGGSIARTDDWQSHGAISLAVTPTAGVNDGFYYDDPNHDFDLSENTLYWPSFDFKGDGGRKYKAYIAERLGTQLGAAKHFTATGHRQRIEFPYREGNATTLVDNLVAYWKLDEATAAARMDSVGNNNLVPEGGANPGPSQIVGLIDNAARFTRASTERLTLADNTGISTGNIDFVFAGWVRLTSKPAGTMALLSKWSVAVGQREYFIHWLNTTDRFRFGVSNDGTASAAVNANNFGAPSTGVWYFIEAWHDSVNDQIGIRVNRGIADTAPHATGVFDSTTQFILGDLGAGQYLDGDLDEWGFWKGRLLSSSELDTLYNGGFGQTYNFMQRRLYVVKDNETNTRPFYVDGLQFEAGDYPTTFLCGDMVGLIPNFVDYYWIGAPHASTSVRVANSADGGRVMNLRQLGLRVKSHVGLGMIGLLAITTPLGNGGSFPQGVKNTEVNFNIIGEISGDEYQSLDMYEQALVDAFNPKRVSPWQPCKILYEPLDDCGNSIGETLEIAAIPDGEFMPLQTDNLNTRVLALPFKRYLPFVAKNATIQGATLSYQEAITANRFLWRDENGNWIGENLSDSVLAMVVLPDGTWALGGNFTNAGGIADADFLVRYDPATRTFSAFNATPLGGQVTSMEVMADGNLAIGGNFFGAGGDANADFLCKLNLTTGVFSSFNATPLNSSVTAIKLMADGNLAIGGTFTNAGGDANADYLARVTVSTGAFSSFNATPLSAYVRSLAVDKVGNLVIGGGFSNAGGDANADFICKLVGTVFTALVSNNPLNAEVTDIEIMDNGDYLLTGQFTNAGGDANGDYAARYSVSSFYALGTGLNAQGFSISRIGLTEYAFGGSFTIAGFVTFADKNAIWNGSAWLPLDVEFALSPTVLASIFSISRIVLGFNDAGTQIVGSPNLIVNNGSDDTLSSYTFRGPGRVVSLKNLANGNAVYFDLVLVAGEEATLTFTGSGAIFGSNLRPNLLGTIIPGSNTNFRLKNGENPISLFMTYTANELNDGGNQLSAYSLQGVTVLNSDNGRLYVSIVNLGGANRRADFYSDSARTLLVAQTGTYAAGGSQAVTQANSSGITGTLTVDVVGAADVDITADFPVVTMKWNPAYASISGAVRPRIF